MLNLLSHFKFVLDLQILRNNLYNYARETISQKYQNRTPRSTRLITSADNIRRLYSFGGKRRPSLNALATNAP